MTFGFGNFASSGVAIEQGALHALTDSRHAIGGNRGNRPSFKRERWPALVSAAMHAFVIGLIIYMPVHVVKQMSVQEIVATTISKPAEEQPKPDEAKPKAPDMPKLLQVPLPEIEALMKEPAIITLRAVPPASASDAAAKADSTEPQTSAPGFDADYLQNPAPIYPNMSRRLRETGTVELRVRVSAAGQPLEIVISKSSGYSRLDDAALAAVKKWKFDPAKRSGVAVEASVIVPVEFSLTH